MLATLTALIVLEVPRRPQRITVGLPSSLTRDVPHLREKTAKAGMIARALGIYRVERVVIYNDATAREPNSDGRLLEKLLSFLEAPQYLRRELFARDSDLQFAGILPPLRLPSHPNPEKPQTGLVREGLVVESGKPSKVNAGFGEVVRVSRDLALKRRVTVRLTRTSPSLEGELVDATRLPIYWGFSITRTDSKLSQMVRGEKPDLTISTSRKGHAFQDVSAELAVRWRASHLPMVLFGSPSQGIPEILESDGVKVSTFSDYNLNTIPDQGVETVRTEEALLATLSCLSQLEAS